MSSSPTNVDLPLEYITVESYAWPTIERAKRSRQQAEVRKLRHRENQRRFMQRKQARITLLRRQVEWMELQLKYLQTVQEEQALRKEMRPFDGFSVPVELTHHDKGNGRCPFEPLDGQACAVPIEFDNMLSEVLLSL